MIMKKIFMTFLICNLGLCMFAQSNIPFVSYTPVYADPVHISPPSMNYNPNDPLGLHTGAPRVNTTTSTQNTDVVRFKAIGVCGSTGNQETGWYDCNYNVILDKTTVKVYAKQLLVFKSIDKEEIWSDEDGNIYLSRKCVDEEGTRCSLDIVQSPSKHIILSIEYSNHTIYYGLIPD